MADNDQVTVWGGTPRIARTPSSGQLLVGNGSGFTLTNSASNMEQTTVGGEPYYGFAGYHGAFQSQVSQTLAAANTATLITYGTTDLSYGVSIDSNPSGPANTRIKVTHAGVYNVQFSLQVVGAVNNKQAYVWLKKNGSDVSYSNTEIDLPNKDFGYVAAWNFLVSLAANEYVELAWASTDAGTILKDGAAPAGCGPSIPSVIATVSLVR